MCGIWTCKPWLAGETEACSFLCWWGWFQCCISRAGERHCAWKLAWLFSIICLVSYWGILNPLAWIYLITKTRRWEIFTESVPWLNTDRSLDLSNCGCSKLKTYWILNRPWFKWQINPQQTHPQHCVTTSSVLRDSDLPQILNISLFLVIRANHTQVPEAMWPWGPKQEHFPAEKRQLGCQTAPDRECWAGLDFCEGQKGLDSPPYKHHPFWVIWARSTGTIAKHLHTDGMIQCRLHEDSWVRYLAVIKIFWGEVFIIGYFSQAFLPRVEKMFFSFSVTGYRIWTFIFVGLFPDKHKNTL